jgi:Txe/YoeB family toxin of Txe-Axe toxin-antitoxin module
MNQPEVPTSIQPENQAEPNIAKPEVAGQLQEFNPGPQLENQPIVSPEKGVAVPERTNSPPSTSGPADDQQLKGDAVPAGLPPVDDQQVMTDDQATPQIADDVDVIEKTWVDKAKKIIDETKGDPYQQEERVEKLQKSYLKKRYGKEIKPSNL